MKNNEPRALKEIHDIRKKIYNETQDLTPTEKAKQTNRIGRGLAEKYGLKTQQKV
jgi:hypothetical protein